MTTPPRLVLPILELALFMGAELNAERRRDLFGKSPAGVEREEFHGEKLRLLDKSAPALH
jgi:hypothetical protein